MSAEDKPRKPPAPDPFADDARTDYRALEPNRTTLGQWDLRYTNGPKAGQFFEPSVEIVKVAKWVPDPKLAKLVRPKGNELLITLKGKHGVLPKKWIVRPKTKRSIAEAIDSYIIQDWPGKTILIYVDPSITFGRDRVGGIRAKRAPGFAPLTEETLNNAVDEELADRIDEAVRVFGEDEEP